MWIGTVRFKNGGKWRYQLYIGCTRLWLHFLIDDTITVSTVGDSLQLTSYCMDTECFGRRQRAEVELVDG